MKKNLTLGQLPADFRPDLHIIIRHESSTGRTMIESGNGVPINPLYLTMVFSGVIKENASALLENQLKQQCNQPHAFVALHGEVKCRVPYCTLPREHEIHNVPVPVQVPTVS